MRVKRERQLHVRLTDEQFETLQRVAISNDRDVSEEIREFIRTASKRLQAEVTTGEYR
jgi:hypothetical protein